MNDPGLNSTIDTCSLIFIALVLFPLIGFFVGLGVNYGLFLFGNNPRWRRLPPPPSPAVELVSAAPGCVYISSANETHYFWCDNHGTEKETWSSYDEVVSDAPGIPCPEAFIDSPADALQAVEFCLATENIDNTQFALFKDGTIKIRRSQGTGWGSFYRGVLLSLGGGMLGLMAAIGFYFYRKSKSEMDSAS